jgi:hypothetical protein
MFDKLEIDGVTVWDECACRNGGHIDPDLELSIAKERARRVRGFESCTVTYDSKSGKYIAIRK